MDLSGFGHNSTEQRLALLEKRVERIALTVDGDVFNSTPSIRSEVKLLHQEIQAMRQAEKSMQHDLQTYGEVLQRIEKAGIDHNRRDSWIHTAVFVALSANSILALVAILTP